MRISDWSSDVCSSDLTYAMWWIRASIQEFILRSWSLVKMGTTAAQKKLFFNLRRMKNNLEAFEDGDLTPEHLTKIATDLGVTEEEVTSMNRRMAMGGDTSLNEIGRAHVCTPVTNAHLVCRLLLEHKNKPSTHHLHPQSTQFHPRL